MNFFQNSGTYTLTFIKKTLSAYGLDYSIKKKITIEEKQTRGLLLSDFSGKLKFLDSGVFHHDTCCLAVYGLDQRVCMFSIMSFIKKVNVNLFWISF